MVKGLDGWWKVRYKGQEGMAPSAYLEKYNQSLPTTLATPTQLVSTPSEAAATAKPVLKTKSPPTVMKSITTLDTNDNRKMRELKSKTVIGKIIGLQYNCLYTPPAAKTAPPPRKESIKVSYCNVIMM